tara:strand:- start:1222 stop:1575 length:354 start_codon:yes stop_codon:yes gene_type:complete
MNRSFLVAAGSGIDITGTHFQGEFYSTWDNLIERLGLPHCDGDGYKVDAQWIFQEDDVIATVYNWKDGPNYNNGEGSVEDVTDWHIGGHDKRAVEMITRKVLPPPEAIDDLYMSRMD